MTIEAEWRTGLDEFATKKISYFKTHLKEGGEIWIGTDPHDDRVTAVAKKGEGDHNRTQKEGCISSVVPTGEGDVDLIRQLNLDKQIYMSRTGVPHDSLLAVRRYKYVRRTNEVIVVDQATGSQVTRDVVAVAKGSSWMGIIVFYVMRIPCPMVVKVPVLFFAISAVSRAAGSGALAPLRSVLRAAWIMVRMVIDFLTDSEGVVGGWFWAFVLSLTWPLFTIVRGGIRAVISSSV